MSKIPHGEPYAGKLHVRFDEGADVPCGGVSPYSTPFSVLMRSLGITESIARQLNLRIRKPKNTNKSSR